MTGATRRELRLETPFGPLAATWTPAPEVDGRPVLVCIPGGTYTRRYFDLHVPDDPRYSFVDYAREAGWSTLCVDPLGAGESARPSDVEVGLDEQADALTSALAQGNDVVGPAPRFVAVGHSMGGYLALRQQARHSRYAALKILGTTNHPVAPLSLPPETIAAAASAAGRRALVDRIVAAMPSTYLDAGREALLAWFHLADVPDCVRRADLATLTVVPRRVAAEGSVPGIGADDAARVDVPVFLAFGEVDVSPAPRTEAAFYTASDDVEVHVLRGSAHCHNMAGTRRRLWDRLLRWVDRPDLRAPRDPRRPRVAA